MRDTGLNGAAVCHPTLNVVDPVTSPTWAELVAGRPSTLFHSPEWMQVVQESFDIPMSACVLEREGHPVAGLPWGEINDALGPRRVTLPFSDFCNVLADRSDDAEALAKYAGSPGLPWTLRSLSGNLPPTDYPVHHVTRFKWHSIDVADEPAVLWDRLSSMARRGVRKAERQGIEVREAQDKRELREWFQLHLRLRKQKYGLLAQPYHFFESIWDHFITRGQGFLLVAVCEGRIVAGNLYLLWQDTCYYKFNASHPDYLDLRPNNLLMWRGMLAARERGCRSVDLGRSSVHQDGLVFFKRSFGAKEDDLYALTYKTGKRDPDAAEDTRRLLQDLTQLLVGDSVPDSVTEEAGTMLYRLFA